MTVKEMIKALKELMAKGYRDYKVEYVEGDDAFILTKGDEFITIYGYNLKIGHQ